MHPAGISRPVTLKAGEPSTFLIVGGGAGGSLAPAAPDASTPTYGYAGGAGASVKLLLDEDFFGSIPAGSHVEYTPSVGTGGAIGAAGTATTLLLESVSTTTRTPLLLITAGGGSPGSSAGPGLGGEVTTQYMTFVDSVAQGIPAKMSTGVFLQGDFYGAGDARAGTAVSRLVGGFARFGGQGGSPASSGPMIGGGGGAEAKSPTGFAFYAWSAPATAGATGRIHSNV